MGLGGVQRPPPMLENRILPPALLGISAALLRRARKSPQCCCVEVRSMLFGQGPSGLAVGQVFFDALSKIPYHGNQY